MCRLQSPDRQTQETTNTLYKLRAASVLIESFFEGTFLGDDYFLTGHPPGYARYVEPSESRCNIISTENNICRLSVSFEHQLELPQNCIQIQLLPRVISHKNTIRIMQSFSALPESRGVGNIKLYYYYYYWYSVLIGMFF